MEILTKKLQDYLQHLDTERRLIDSHCNEMRMALRRLENSILKQDLQKKEELKHDEKLLPNIDLQEIDELIQKAQQVFLHEDDTKLKKGKSPNVVEKVLRDTHWSESTTREKKIEKVSRREEKRRATEMEFESKHRQKSSVQNIRRKTKANASNVPSCKATVNTTISYLRTRATKPKSEIPSSKNTIPSTTPEPNDKRSKVETKSPCGYEEEFLKEYNQFKRLWKKCHKTARDAALQEELNAARQDFMSSLSGGDKRTVSLQNAYDIVQLLSQNVVNRDDLKEVVKKVDWERFNSDKILRALKRRKPNLLIGPNINLGSGHLSATIKKLYQNQKDQVEKEILIALRPIAEQLLQDANAGDCVQVYHQLYSLMSDDAALPVLVADVEQ